MKTVIPMLIVCCLLAVSCDEWKSHPAPTHIDRGQEYVPPGETNRQDYISQAKVAFTRDNLISQGTVHIVLSDGRTTWQRDLGNANPSFEVETATSGTLTMDFTMRSTEGHTVSNGSVSWPLEPDNRISITIERSAHDPKAGCWGCTGSRSFQILDERYKDDSRDAVYVVWGRNSISNPVRY